MASTPGETIATYPVGENTYAVKHTRDGFHVVDVDRNIDLTEGEPFAAEPSATDVLALADANEIAWATDEADEATEPKAA